ncbi:hypothetical protein [Nocardioides yefusunii]|uniref:Uncharacterized protein n=1 Tax=Nocardioides yefusunii TaxID=2500546 RepID=A0ABW1QZP5_9ACTN|nr:hypothetical protein [Nocardioides yefusunii]
MAGATRSRTASVDGAQRDPSTETGAVVFSVTLGVAIAAGLMVYGYSTGAGAGLWAIAVLWGLFAMAVPFGAARGRRLDS